jgi:[ribosomal protein S18]-alanine N-acetyltransferase
MRKYFLRPGSPEMHVRRATRSDLPRLKELERESVTAAHWSPAHYEATLAAPKGLRLVLVIEDHSVVGFLLAHHIADEWEIENILIASAFQRRGLGSQLLRTFLDIAKQSGTKSIFLEVRESNQAARALYEKSGFAQSGRRSRYYRDPGEDAIPYKLEVESCHPTVTNGFPPP